MLKGYKTYIGAAVMASSAALAYLGYDDMAKMVLTLAGAIGLIGIRSAMK